MSKLTLTKHLKALALDAKEYAERLVGSFATAAIEAIEEIDSNKSDKTAAVVLSIPAVGWSKDEDATSYPYYYDVEVSGVTAKDRAAISIAPDSIDAAIACGLCPTNQTIDGKIRLWAKKAPIKAITAEYWLEQGKEN